MTTKHLMIAAAIVTIGFSACTAKESKEVEVLNTYVDSVENLTPVYTTEYWTVIDNGYQERLALAEKDYAALDAEAKTRADASKARYEALKARYEQNIKDAQAAANPAPGSPNFRKVLRDRLFGEGKIGDDMQFAFVTGDNILGIYQNFVDVVADNRNSYTREDWDEINVLYEALDTRKNAVEKDLKSSDNLKIAGLKIKFASIAATNRGGTKVKENEDSKQ
ncbi:MAG: hypothetical protein IPO42_03645 [Chitinophagaceae bacterium]|nr:hypothetical protein [Chitinophagaceae bacterium]